MKNTALKFWIVGVVGVTASSTTQAAVVDLPPGFRVTTLPFTDTASTVGLNNDIDWVASSMSPYNQVDGPDAFYLLEVAETGSITFSITPDPDVDLAIYLFKESDLPPFTDTGAGNDVLAGWGSDSGFPSDPETFTVNDIAPGIYYFVVDSYYSTGDSRAAGGFTLTITGDAVLAVPEPASPMLVAAGAVGMLGWRNRRRGAFAKSDKP